MALIDCPDCGNPISTEAYTCPKCGRPTARQRQLASTFWKRKLIIWGVSVAVFYLVWQLMAR